MRLRNEIDRHFAAAAVILRFNLTFALTRHLLYLSSYHDDVGKRI